MNSGTELVFFVQNVEFCLQQNPRKCYTQSCYFGLEYAPNPLMAGTSPPGGAYNTPQIS